MDTQVSVPFSRCVRVGWHQIFSAFCCLLLLDVLVANAGPIPSDKPNAYPGWWFIRDVITSNDSNPTPVWNDGWGDYPAPDDFSVANIGQLKQMATQAAAEFNAHCPGGAGADITNLIAQWNSSPTDGAVRDDYAALNLGQLKSVASLFYTRLINVHYTNSLPWAGALLAADDYSVANLGQLKALFSFDVGYCSTTTGIPDWWALLCYGTTTINPSDSDGLGDNLSILQAFRAGLTPDFYHGSPPVISIVSGDGQTVGAGTTLPQTVTFQVADEDGNPIPNAPVTLSINAGLMSLTGDLSTASSQIRTNADANGFLTVTVFAPNYNVPFEITVEAVSGNQTVSAIAEEAASESASADGGSPAPQPPHNYPQPALQMQSASSSRRSFPFKQYTVDPQPISYYKKETWSFTEDSKGTDSNGNPTSATGSYNTVITVDPKTGALTYTGGTSSSESHSIADSGAKLKRVVTSTQNADGSWQGTETDTYTDGNNNVTTFTNSVNTPAMSAPAANLTGATQTVQSYGTPGPGNGISGTKTLSEDYKLQDCVNDTPTPSSYSNWLPDIPGDILASINATAASCSLKNGKYKWVLDQSFEAAPYPTFSWYEVYVPADQSAAWTVKQQQWENAGSTNESSEFLLDATKFPDGQNAQQVNGQWSLVQIFVEETSGYPLCKWRNVIGAGENVTLILKGVPDGFGDPSWSISSGSGGTGILTSLGGSASFQAGIKEGDVTINASIKSKSNPGAELAKFSIVFSVKVPQSIIMKKDHEDVGVFAKGEAGAGMWLETTIQPTDVSFSGLQVSEGPTSADPSGPRHNPAGPSGIVQLDNPSQRAWVGVWDDNRCKGLDHAKMGPIPRSPQPPFYDGSQTNFTWHIPWYFKLDTDASGTGTQFTTMDHIESLDVNTGHAEIKKSTGDVKRDPNQ